MFHRLIWGLFFLFSVGASATCVSDLDAFSSQWKEHKVARATPQELLAYIQKKYPNAVGDPASLTRYGVARALRKVLTARIEAHATLDAAKKAELLGSLARAVAEFQGPPGKFPGSGEGGNGGGNGPPFNNFSSESAVPDSRLVAEVEEYFEKPSFRQCVGETALLLTVSSVVSAAGAVIVNWNRMSPGSKSFIQFLTRDLFKGKTWKNAWNDAEFAHIMTWNSIIRSSMGAMSCMGNKNAGRNAMTAISLGASLFDQWRSGEWSLRQTLMDVFWIRYVSFFKTGRALHYSRSYAASGRAYPKLVETTLQTASELIGAFGYPLVNKFSKSVWDGGERLLILPPASPFPPPFSR